MTTGKCGACFRCCSVQYVHPNVHALKDKGSCPWNCVQYQSTSKYLQTVSTLEFGYSAKQVSEDVLLPAAETAKAFEGTMLAGRFYSRGLCACCSYSHMLY